MLPQPFRETIAIAFRLGAYVGRKPQGPISYYSRTAGGYSPAEAPLVTARANAHTDFLRIIWYGAGSNGGTKKKLRLGLEPNPSVKDSPDVLLPLGHGTPSHSQNY